MEQQQPSKTLSTPTPPFQTQPPLCIEDQTKLLFFENFSQPKPQYTIEEIFFSKAVLLHQIRILKSDSNPHTKIKSMQSITQRTPIYKFEIFARNLKKVSDVFEKVFESEVINKENGELDTIFPFSKELITNHIVFRGSYEKITMCIYGIPFTGTDNHLLLETAKNEVALEKLSEIKSNQELNESDSFTPVKPEEMELIKKYPIDTLISPYIESATDCVIKRAYNINKPNVYMVDKTKTGYIYYENDIQSAAQLIMNLYLTYSKGKTRGNVPLPSDRDIIDHQKSFKILFEIMKILFSRNYTFLEDDCVFRNENLEILNKIPDIVIQIIINSLNGNFYGYTEIKYGLKLLKYISNSQNLVNKFIEYNGLDKLYTIIFQNEDEDSSNSGSGGSSGSSSNSGNNNSNNINGTYCSIIKALALECIYRCITFRSAFERFINGNSGSCSGGNCNNNSNNTNTNSMQNTSNNNNTSSCTSSSDRKKFMSLYFSIKDIDMASISNLTDITSINGDTKSNNNNSSSTTKDQKESSKDKKKDKKDKDRDKDKKHKKKHHHSHSSKKDKSRSRSRSKSKDTKKSSSKKDSSSSKDKPRDRSSSKHKKSKKNQIPLKNGYQVIIALFLSNKKKVMISTLIKNIIIKVNLMLYMQSFNNSIQAILNNNTINVDFDKLIYQLTTIFQCITKLKISYKKCDLAENKSDSFLDNDYPFKQYWNDFIKTNRRFYKKFDDILYNTKSTLENDTHAYTKLLSAGVITNEIAYLLGAYSFLENLLLLICNEQVQMMNQFYDISIIIKHIFTYILLSKGGVNYLSKEIKLTETLYKVLCNVSQSIQGNDIVDESNFFMAQTESKEIYLNQSLYEPMKYARINELLIQTSQSNVDLLNDDMILKINFLQLKYLLEYSFTFMTHLDNLIIAREEGNDIMTANTSDYVNKSLNVLLNYNQNINKSNLSLQAFLALAQNPFFLDEILTLLTTLTNDNISDFEGHIALIINLLHVAFCSLHITSDVLLLLYGRTFYDALITVKQTLIAYYDMKEAEPINSNLYSDLDALISLLLPIKDCDNCGNVRSLMTSLNESLYNNLQKHNLNETLKIHEEKTREILNEYKLNVQKHDNNDINFLEKMMCKGSLMNEIFTIIKTINLSTKINSLLLLDCVSEHIHLALRYLIINGVNSFKYFINSNYAVIKYNAKNNEMNLLSLAVNPMQETNETMPKTECLVDKYDNIKEICTLLYHVFDILRTLLCNLLSSHVDTFRDSSIISKTESTIIECINFLYEIYVGSNNNSNSSVSSNINVSVVYYIQKVFESALKAYEQICKFNTTIKLNFPVLVEKIVATPKNKLGVVYLINFMLNVVNNEYTVESFVDCLTEETQHNQAIDLFSEIDNTKHPIHLSSLANDKSNILKYMIQSAITSNNDFLITQTGEIIQTIFKRYVAKNKLNIFNEITDEIKNQLKTAFNKVSNIKCGLLAEKDYEIYLQDFEAIIRILKFIMIFVKGDYKFLFIFHDIAFCYYKLLAYCRDYFNQIDLKANSNETNLLRDVIFDIMFLLLEGLDAICDSKRNNNKKFFYEKNIRYDLVEDLPSKEHIVTIIRELNNVLVFYCSVIDMNQSGTNVTVNKMTLIVKKILDIYASLGLNFYGQNILLNQEYALKTYLPNNVLPQDTKPLISLAKLINVLVNAAENKIINNVILEITESLAQLIIILLYDLNYYENIAYNNNNNNKEFQLSKMMVITKIRLHALANLFIDIGASGSSNTNTNSNVSNNNNNNTSPSSLHTNTTPIEKSISILISVLSKLKYLVDFFSENKSQTISFELCKSWEVLKKHQTNMDILDIDIKLGMLPNIRKIDVKFDLLNKFYNYYDIQPYGINFPYEITNADLHNLRSSHLTNSFTGGNFGENNMPMQPILGDKSQINEFSKLLNWKKHRIFLTKENSLNVRNRIFDLDTCVHSQGELKFFNEFDFYKLKKKHFYFNTDQFEQYCNGVFNSNLKIKTFANVSYAMTASTLNKIYLLSDESQSYNLKKYFLNHLSKSKANIGDVIRMEREHNGMNLLLNQNQTLLNRIKKKINSKLNLFIYKTKYEKYSSQIKPVSNPPPSSISKEQIRSMSKVSGRNLSTHVDNVVPGQKVVNLTYGGQPTNANVNGSNEDDNGNKEINGSGNNNVSGNNGSLLNANNQQIQKTGSNVGTTNTSMMINNNGGVGDVSGTTNTTNNNVNPNGMVIDSTIQQSQIKNQNDNANASVNVANPTTNLTNPSQTQRPLLHPTNPVPLPQQIPFQQQPQDPNTSQQPGIPTQPMQPFNPMLKMQPYTLSGMPSFMMMNSMMRPSFPGMMPQPGIYPQFQQFQGIPMSMMGQMPQHPQAQAQQPQMPNQPQTQMMTAATATQQAQMQTQPQMQTQLQDTVMSNANAQVNSTTQQTQSDGTVQQHQQGGQNKNGLNVLGNIMFTLEKPNQQGNEKSKDPRMRKKNK